MGELCLAASSEGVGIITMHLMGRGKERSIDGLHKKMDGLGWVEGCI